MNEEIGFLTRDDQQLIRQLLADYKNGRLNPVNRTPIIEQDLTAPEVYLVRVPAGGIAGYNVESTGTASDDQFPSVDCNVYAVIRNDPSSATVRYMGFKITVFNYSLLAVQGNDWILAVRDKGGPYYAAIPLQSAGAWMQVTNLTPTVFNRYAGQLWSKSTGSWVNTGIIVYVSPPNDEKPYKNTRYFGFYNGIVNDSFGSLPEYNAVITPTPFQGSYAEGDNGDVPTSTDTLISVLSPGGTGGPNDPLSWNVFLGTPAATGFLLPWDGWYEFELKVWWDLPGSDTTLNEFNINLNLNGSLVANGLSVVPGLHADGPIQVATYKKLFTAGDRVAVSVRHDCAFDVDTQAYLSVEFCGSQPQT